MGNTLQRQDVSARGDEWRVVQTSQLEPAPEQSSTRQPQLEQYLAESGARDARRLRILHAVAHEVRNHLNAIRLVATCLTKGADLNGNREDLAVLASNVCDIDALIERLVDFANLLFGEEKLNPECLNLADLHRDVAFVLRKMAEDKGLRFSGTVEQGLVEVVSDCLKLREIALNLGTDAVKYTRSGSVGLRFARHGSVLDAGSR
jgi:signal transduction histidine kinase